MTKYLRFGDIPESGKSKIWRGEECIGEEEGVSVYEIKFDKDKHISICLPFPFHRDTLDTLTALTKYDNRPCYIVTGEYVGKGTDGEPLISNVQIVEEFTKIISDEKMLRTIIRGFENWKSNGMETFNNTKVDDILAYLEKQKEQKSVEWSEEDEKNIGKLHRLLVICQSEKKFIPTSEYEKLDKWLKSLRPQQERQMPNSTQLIAEWEKEKAMLEQKDFRGDAERMAYNAFLDGFIKGLGYENTK